MIKRIADYLLTLKDARGFSLIELLVTVAIVGMLMAAVYSVQIANMRAVQVEEERVEIQQDQRIAIDFLTSELRMAGYDKAESSAPTIVDARSNFIYFTVDRNDDGVLDDNSEHIAFCLWNDPDYGQALGYVSGSADTVGDVGGAVGGAALNIGHVHNAGGHEHETVALAEDIEFFYTLVDGTQTTSPTAGQMGDIRSVDVTLLSRADTPDPRYVDSQIFVPTSGTAFNGGNAYGDTTRRRIISVDVRFRNMGLD